MTAAASTVRNAIVRLLPRPLDYADLRTSWRRDLLAGLTVSVVALPLALGFGISTGLGAGPGLITAIVAGIIAAIFGGSHVQVSGPTGAMTVVLAPLVVTHGASSVVEVGVLAGVMILLAGLLRMGRLLEFIPTSVIEGFTLGIAIIIFLQQVPMALGIAKPAGTNTGMVALTAVSRWVHALTWPSIAVTLGTIAVIALCRRLHESIPASLVAIVVATLAVLASTLDVATIGTIPTALPHLVGVRTGWGHLALFLRPAFAVAMLAAIESLLSAKVADRMVDVPPHHPDRELFGQGLANVAASVLGGMPATGAIARTAVNVRAGARTRVASIVHALILVLIVLVGSRLVAVIPLPALAGVLIMTAIHMVNPKRLGNVAKATRSDAVVLVVTTIITVVFDLILAVEIGVAAAALLSLRHVARTSTIARDPVEADLTGETSMGREIAVYRLQGALFFGTSSRFLRELSTVPDVQVVILRLPQVQVMDATGAEALGDIVSSLEKRGITVLLEGPRLHHLAALLRSGSLHALRTEKHIFDSLMDAEAHAISHVRRAEAR